MRLKSSIRTEKSKNAYLNVVWSPDGQTIAVGGAKDNSINFYDFRKGESVFSHQLRLDHWEYEGKKYDNDGINEFSWNKSGSVFFTTLSDKMSSLL